MSAPFLIWPGRFGVGNDQNTLALLNMEGGNGTTTFFDSSSFNRTITASSNAQVSTSNQKFGLGCLLVDGTISTNGGFLSIPDSADLEFGANNFTYDLWARPTTVAGLGTVIDKRATNVSYGGALILRNATSYRFYASSNGTSYDIASAVFMGTAVVNTYSALAISRQTTAIRLFQDGALITTVTSASAIINNSSNITIGCIPDGTAGFTGQIDAVRISNVARYTAAYQVMITPYL